MGGWNERTAGSDGYNIRKALLINASIPIQHIAIFLKRFEHYYQRSRLIPLLFLVDFFCLFRRHRC